MQVSYFDGLSLISAEIWLVCASMFLLLLGACRKGKDNFVIVLRLGVVALAVTIAIIIAGIDDAGTILSGQFSVSSFTQFVKILILISTILVLLISVGFFKSIEGARKFEFVILVMLSVVGMMMMVSSASLMALYVGLELQSLALYVLASLNRDSKRSSEAGVKYFVLGSLSSAILLYGCSFVYGFTGTLQFDALAERIVAGDNNLGLLFGFILVLVGLLFKISAVPFHMWTPDVYEGSPTPVTAFFSVAPKIAALGLLITVLLNPFANLIVEWQQILLFVSMVTMIIGALGALPQNNIKRLMAYSSIGHVGYMLMGVVSAKDGGISAVLIYLAIYMTMSIGVFASILLMRSKSLTSGGTYLELISDMSGLHKNHPVRALLLAIFMLSMAGIPPFAGFWGKFFIFESAISAGFYSLAIVGIVTSVVATYYYLRIIKVMYFEDGEVSFDRDICASLRLVLFVVAIFNVFFFVYPSALFEIAKGAVSLF